MQDKSFSKIKKQHPVSVIVHATNILGKSLAKILLEQGSKVILIDRFDAKSKELIVELKKFGEVDFVDLEGLEDLMKNIGRVDYLFYLQSEFLLTCKSFTSKDFLEESNNLNLCLKVGQKYNAKVSLVTSIALNEKLLHSAQNIRASSYSPEDLQKYSETLTAEYHDKSKMNARILRIGAILGEESNIENFETLDQLFEDSVVNNSINILGEGLNIHYLINLSDLVFGILKLTFSPTTNGEVISVCNNNDYTTLSIAYKLLELNPNASEIKFVPNTERRPVLHGQYVPAPNAQEYGWKQKKSLEKSFAETLQSKYEKHKKKWNAQPLTENAYQEKLEEIRARKTRVRDKRGNVNFVTTPTGEILSKATKPFRDFSIKNLIKSEKFLKNFLITLALLIVFYFLVYPLVSITAGGVSVYKSATSISNFDNFEIEDNLYFINKNIQNVGKSFDKLKWGFAITQQQEMHDEISLLLHGLEKGSEGLINLAEGVQPFVTYMEEFEPALSFQDGQPTTTRDYTKTLQDLEQNSDQISQAVYKISEALKIIKNADVDTFPKFLQARLGEVKDEAAKLEVQIDAASNIASFLPESLGVNERKRYLVLLQNPGELRSTGGWISSYALLGLEGGQIRELVVDDVYNLDGELKNKEMFFEAPKEMVDALEIEEVSLSLSNWDPNFPDTAKNASFFVKEAGKAHKIDGVITLDIYLLQNLLDSWGGIYIAGESDLITSDNIYEKVFFLHKNFTPGESQKATFLTSLADETIKRIFSANFNENKGVFSILLNGLNSKNVLIYFENLQAQQYFSQKGWTGEITSQKYQGLPFSVEWNWGANKANLYLEREQRMKMDIKSASLVEYEYALILKNNSSSKTYPQGDYQNYLRVYIPETAEVTSAIGFNEDVYVESFSRGFKILEGWFNVPTKTTKELKIAYNIEEPKDIFKVQRDEISFTTKLFKQPGTSQDDNLRLEIFYPQNWAIVEQGEFDRSRIHLIQQTKLDREKEIHLEWELL